MSPLGRFLLIAMLWGVRFALGAIAAIFALVVWQKWFAGAAAAPVRQDYAFLAVLAVMFIAAWWFARALKRELDGIRSR